MSILAKNLKASTVLNFAGTDYKAIQVLTYADRVEVVFEDTNDGQPYTFLPEEVLVLAD